MAYQDYRQIHTELQTQIDGGDLDSATLLNTSREAATSEEAFGRFQEAIETLRSINQQVFDDIWANQKEALPRNQLLYGLISYGVLVLLVVAGLYHRYREL
ncbi:MAG TPA: hypothetical protein VHO69_14725 [Phototrophicaceae bacterium]|nr:hypothetical protein [Phototrophicaceae bacterium]